MPNLPKKPLKYYFIRLNRELYQMMFQIHGETNDFEVNSNNYSWTLPKASEHVR